MLWAEAPEWWIFSLDCASTICYRILIGKIAITSLTASDLKLDLNIISSLVDNVFDQNHLSKNDITWHPQVGKCAVSRSATKHAVKPIFSSRFTSWRFYNGSMLHIRAGQDILAIIPD